MAWLLCLSFLLLKLVETAGTGPRPSRTFTIDENGYLSANFPLIITEYHIALPTVNLVFAYPVSFGSPLFTARAATGDFTYKAAFNGVVIGAFAKVGEVLEAHRVILQVKVDGVEYAGAPEGIEEEAYSTSFEHFDGLDLPHKMKDLVYNDFGIMAAQN